MQVPLELSFHGLDSSDALRDIVDARVERLESIFGDIVSCRVVIEVTHRDSEDHIRSTRVRCELSLPGTNLIADAKPGDDGEPDGDVYQGVDMAFDRLERQLRTWVDKVQEHSSQRFPTKANGFIASVNRLERSGFVEMTDGREVYFEEPALRGADLDELKRGDDVKVVVGSSPDSPYPVARKVRAA